MAKEIKEKSPSWDDFSEENLLADPNEKKLDGGLEEEEEDVKEEKRVVSKKTIKKDPELEEEIQLPSEKKKKETESLDASKLEEEETPKDEEPDPDYAVNFLGEVEKLTGNQVKVDYGEVDPVSPQGIALREKAVKELTLSSFLEDLETNFPKVYEALEYANNGGDPAELFKHTTARDYSNVILKEGDNALAKEILKEYYQARGVKSEGRLAKMLELAEESEEGIVKEAESALEELKTEQEGRKAELLKLQQTEAVERKRKDGVFVASLDEVLDSRQLGTFKIGDKTEANEFRKFIMNSVKRSDDGGYQFVTKIESGNVEKLLQYQYFQFKKGDLSKIIQAAASTQNAKNLSLRFREEQKKKKTIEETVTGKASMKDYEN